MCRCACSTWRFPAGTVGSEQQLQSGLLSLLLWALLSSQSLNIRSSWEHLRASSFLYPHSLWRSPPDPGLSTYTTYLLTASQSTSPAGTFRLNSRPTYPGVPIEYVIIISDFTCLNQTPALPPQTCSTCRSPYSILPGAQDKSLEAILDSFFSFIHVFQSSREFN